MRPPLQASARADSIFAGSPAGGGLKIGLARQSGRWQSDADGVASGGDGKVALNPSTINFPIPGPPGYGGAS